ncbi:MAG: hypothetical protein EOR30_21475 [Mesorhizobium sp.]|uniref:glycerophosphoryl diester phosphodiesterase membrane domain-containing protein n=1 Tax=unclassified Mesorhizobium TaxID=325217 RepID=UPI000FCAB1B4|nr:MULTISPECIES: glycerophosphoryl diester phosphodiesterase membrane domain-containing protein [unclassified Mesorhizobium]TGT93740.1 hypothetical protein EN807_26100 [Mesorhizobium sp. M5C.F.Ca.ET.164.01.1.1]RUV75343.1 hypothetical protein EOA78_06500 [Mesorhizobium sp. M5C.F.Cr.IN.023.01.1.1]RWB30562.1 MAG: hypothetical protein EOQ43_15565 [Mesorhizobium sp.]RWC13608.1 MAG: hypothetical protein EOS51_20560 [Mesorhizobium sp.]RWD19414.1 MAG: hypothetical protein EOS57_12735 [Mesorhizobium sp
MVSTTLERPGKFRIGRVFNDSFAVISRNPGLLVGLAALFSGLPTLVFQLWALSRLAPFTAADPAASFDPSTLGEPNLMASYSAITIGFGLVSYILSLLLQASLVRATIEDLNGKQPSFGDCVAKAVSFLLPTFAIALLVGLGVVLGLMLLIVPGIMLALRWSVAVPALVQERLGVFGSMARSRDLTKGSRWALFGLFVILIIIVIAIQLALGTATALFGWGVMGAVVDALVTSVTSMVMSIATAVCYVELRQVREGTSVDELAEIFS